MGVVEYVVVKQEPGEGMAFFYRSAGAYPPRVSEAANDGEDRVGETSRSR